MKSANKRYKTDSEQRIYKIGNHEPILYETEDRKQISLSDYILPTIISDVNGLNSPTKTLKIAK